MKNYRGYYIDGTAFTTEAEIDAFIKAQNIKRMQMFNAAMFNAIDTESMMAANAQAMDTARYLHDHCGMSWAEIEEAEYAA